MSDLAPWESSGDKQIPRPDAPTQKVPRRATGRLAEIYKRQTDAFITPQGNVVPRPPETPRPLEPRGRIALYVLGAVAGMGLAWVGVVFLIFSAEAGTLRIIYAAAGILPALAALGVLVLELPRLGKYRTANFIPGVLVYGSRLNFEKVLGPAGIGSVTLQLARGTGQGVLSKVFDRSSHKTAPPEIVALHINRGAGPEMIGVEWDAVRELQRGDIVWFALENPRQLLMFHKLVPYAPWVAQDAATRKEVFEALHVGANMYQERVDAKNMGTTKVVNTDADGKLQVGDQTGPPQPRRGANTKQLGLTSQGGLLGGEQQYDQTEGDFGVDPNQSTEKTGQYRIGKEGSDLAEPNQLDPNNTEE